MNLKPFTVRLDNLFTGLGKVTVSVYGPGVAGFAKDQTIAGSPWETTSEENAHALVDDHPGLVEQLEQEGYTLNLDSYISPEKEPT